MALVLKDRVKETTTTTGTGTLTLGGAVSGFQAFSVIGNGNTTYYAIQDTATGDWEVGLGTVGTGTLARTAVYESSNSNNLVNFAAGTKDVFVTLPAEYAVTTVNGQTGVVSLSAADVGAATTAQGLLADSALQPAAIGTTVQAYSSNLTGWSGLSTTAKQDTLVSGTNIKTINTTSLLGSGDVSVQATLVSGTNIKTINSTSLLGSGDVAVQPTLVSGTNIKTINSTSLLGSGNIIISNSSAIGYVIDGGGATITTGLLKNSLRVPFGCTINSVTLLADQSGSIVVDIWKDTYANYPPTVADSICGSAKPTLSSAIKSEDTTLTGWTTSIADGDTLRFYVDSATTVQNVTLILKVTKI